MVYVEKKDHLNYTVSGVVKGCVAVARRRKS
jgi:hypothetical protein